MASPDFKQPFFIQTDASDVGLGAVLFQVNDGREHPIAFASRTLTAVERKYSVTERELLAIIFAIEKFRCYVEGLKFTVITDHHSLLWLHNLKNPSGRLCRWSARLSQYAFDIEHRPGRTNIVPDILSRNVDIISTKNLKPDDWYKDLLIKVNSNPNSYPNFIIRDGFLYKQVASSVPISSNISKWKLLIPVQNQAEVLQECHDHPTSGHFGVSKTLAKVKMFYYWPKMRRSVAQYVKNCKICAAQKSPNEARVGLMGREKDVDYPFQLISLDLMGPFPKSKSGYQHLLVVTDWFSKFVLTEPLRVATSSAVIKFLKNRVFLVFGAPQTIIMDNGAQFISKEFHLFLSNFKIKNRWYNAKYHPQHNPTERVNRVLITAISSYIKDNHRDWDLHLAEVTQALNLAKHEVTQLPPSFLIFGRHVPVDGEFYEAADPDPEQKGEVTGKLFWQQNLQKLPLLYNDIKDRLHKAYKNSCRQYNLRKRDVRYKVGDIVWKKVYSLSKAGEYYSKKLAAKYMPCVVVKASPPTYQLKDFTGKGLGCWHSKDLKLNTCDFDNEI